ncbi:MAG: hypothetical protein V1692_00855, partial [bacterium]
MMAVQSTGNVGIGTTAPGEKLSVWTGATGTKGIGIRAASGQTANLLELQRASDGIALSFFNKDGAWAIDTGSGNSYLALTNSGVRFGTAVLNVESAVATEIPVIIRGGVSQSVDLTQWQNSSGTVLNVINSSGNVGIGTTVPGAKLEVVSASNVGARVTTDGVGRFDLYTTAGGNTRNWALKTSVVAEGDLALMMGTSAGAAPSSYVMYANKDGYVGIGTTNPVGLLTLSQGGTTSPWLSLIQTGTGGRQYQLISTGSSSSTGAGNF